MNTRYDRQIILIGAQGQKKLTKATIVIVGIGALGTVVSEILSRAGVGKIILIDRDIVEITNLQRQSLFTEDDLNLPKAMCARERLAKINSEISLIAKSIDLTYENIAIIKTEYKTDIIVDCTDSLSTRFLLNDFCMEQKIPLIHGAAVGTTGNVFVVKDNACLRCFLSEKQAEGTCETLGVMGTITHLIGTLQANEVLKIILNKKFETSFLRINIETNSFEKFSVSVQKDCKTHNKKYEYLQGKEQLPFKICGDNRYQLRTKKSYTLLQKKLKKYAKNSTSEFLQLSNLTLFKDGRVLVHAKSEKEARSIFSKYIGN